MKFTILTIFKNSFSYFQESIIKRWIDKKLFEIDIIDIRDFSTNKHKKVDDELCWGGQWMLMTCQPIADAINFIKKKSKKKTIKVIFFTAIWETISQEKFEKFSEKKDIEYILVCGRYEWIDQRVIDIFADYEISIWNFVLTWWEIPAMLFVDWVARLLDWVLWDKNSHIEESFSKKLWWKKEFPNYTKPREFMWKKVPEVLLNWNHKKIEKWKKDNLR